MKRHEAFITKGWREAGLANIAVTRTDDDGTADAGFYLVDPLCLGVKDTFTLDDLTADELREIIEQRFPEDTMERMHPAWAKKFIEGAIAHAERAGFNPHHDYRKSRRVLASIDADVCTETFVYGDDGRPHYIQGAEDDDERANRVLSVLDARLGPGGYAVTMREDMLNDPDISDAAIAHMHKQLERTLKKMNSGYNVQMVAGILTALLCRPDIFTADDAMDLFRNDADADGKPYAEHHLAMLDNLIELYWAQLDSMLESAMDDANNDPWPFDFYEDDFPEDGMFLRALMHWMFGFQAAVTLFEDIWAEARARPELADHWKLVNYWGNPDNPDGLFAKLVKSNAEDKSGEAAGEDDALPNTRSNPPAAIVAIYRALRPEEEEATEESEELKMELEELEEAETGEEEV